MVLPWCLSACLRRCDLRENWSAHPSSGHLCGRWRATHNRVHIYINNIYIHTRTWCILGRFNSLKRVHRCSLARSRQRQGAGSECRRCRERALYSTLSELTAPVCRVSCSSRRHRRVNVAPQSACTQLKSCSRCTGPAFSKICWSLILLFFSVYFYFFLSFSFSLSARVMMMMIIIMTL